MQRGFLYMSTTLKETTGKSTGILINERNMIEAKALSQYTDWSVGDIASRGQNPY